MSAATVWEEKDDLKAISDSELTKLTMKDYAQAFDGSKRGKFVIMPELQEVCT